MEHEMAVVATGPVLERWVLVECQGWVVAAVMALTDLVPLAASAF